MCYWQIFIFIVTMYGVPLIAALVAWVGTTRAVALAYASVAVLHVVTWAWLVPAINHALVNVWGLGFEAWAIILLGDIAIYRLEEGGKPD
jgi:hypothetical protein